MRGSNERNIVIRGITYFPKFSIGMDGETTQNFEMVYILKRNFGKSSDWDLPIHPNLSYVLLIGITRETIEIGREFLKKYFKNDTHSFSN